MISRAAVAAAAVFASACTGYRVSPDIPPGFGPVDVTLKRLTPREEKTRSQLRRLLGRYDVSRWVFTRAVVIEERPGARNPSVLTLNTRHLGKDDRLLASFIHAQIEWYAASRAAQVAAAVVELKDLYPVPESVFDGARSRDVAYRGLVVCRLEYQAMTELLGGPAARVALERAALENDALRWSYLTVISDAEKIKTVLDRYKLKV